LVGEWLQVGYEFEKHFGFLESGLALGVVSEVEHHSPVNFSGNRHDARESLLNDGWEATFLVVFHLTADLLVLVLAVRCLHKILLQPLNTLTALELHLHLRLLVANGLPVEVKNLTATVGEGLREGLGQLWHRSHALKRSGKVGDHISESRRRLHRRALTQIR